MKADEIRIDTRPWEFWLKECAYQLALANERGTAEPEAKRLRELCGCVYQFIGANMLELGGCRRFLDALSNASEGRPFDVEHLLPYSPEERVCMTDVAQPASAPQRPDASAGECAGTDADNLYRIGDELIGVLLRHLPKGITWVHNDTGDEHAAKVALAVAALNIAARRIGLQPDNEAVDAHDNEGRN